MIPYMFKGCFNEFPSPDSVNPGDIVILPDEKIYVYLDNSWVEIEQGPSDEYQEAVEAVNKKIVPKCRACGGILKDLSDEDIRKGFVRCEYCGSLVNLFEEAK